MTVTFPAPGSHDELEEGQRLTPKFDRDGLVGAIVTDVETGDVLMFAHMNAEALAATIETGVAHFFSRSRGKLWRKGETSGHEMSVAEMRVDCDQDALWLRVRVAGTGAACHTGRKSCFYRAVPTGEVGAPLRLVDDARLFDPAKTYGG
ncbi:phosphoribosyl-AMP cyclohydrolase [Chenggangzhangella methanolivorans]|uniref:Phosphoribosyl-AMP cyclohydrolase n=1 Tax=Chenggangzhangella methanolivorans TaxID=1437009 RepID=A0A9E6R9N9_9HYPH|nr:phosphoribosyl-AMP cyclohydrolase [Chenggangzhangella methanolivorans]QZO00746.1 phosphoribosyl-AMP cyclohydrolase [Chenggangzhangella methanolivorans]